MTKRPLSAAAVLDNPAAGTVGMRKSMRLLQQDLNCPLCTEVFRNPSTLSSCGHTFCEACIQRYSENSYNCPVKSCGMSVTCKSDGGKFIVNNPALGSAVESWTALMQTLANAKPEWWTNVNVDVDVDTTRNADDAVPVAKAASARAFESESEDDGPTIDLQAAVDLQIMEHGHAHAQSSSPGSTTQDETVYGTAESRPRSDDDDDDDDTDDGL
jgi:hypothetical protein